MWPRNKNKYLPIVIVISILFLYNPWNQGRPRVKKCIQLLEENSDPLLVVEKNLFNLKELEKEGGGPLTDEENDRFEKEGLGRCTFVWLLKDMAKFKTIEFTFNQFDGGSGQEQPTEPVEPEKEPLIDFYKNLVASRH